MMALDRFSFAPWPDQHKPVVVRSPQPHEGVHRALKSSFATVPAMPDDLADLLARLR